jgi:transaldolase / glucose-6-phosphate isomerase
MTNPLRQLADHGQSFWLDNLSRSLIVTGELAGLIRDDGLRGITSNPTIFEKALSEGDRYDDDIARLAGRGLSSEEIFEEVAIDDVRTAADMLRPVYDESGGNDGFVSLELPPALAFDTEGSILEAKRLFTKVDRPNIMIKVPGTREGLPAIEQLIYEGVNVNITLLFSIQGYETVTEAYLRGLERRHAAGMPLSGIASVASFFVSRVDTEADTRLDRLIESATDESTRSRLQALKGKVAIANAKVAYQRFKAIFLESRRFDALRRHGANLQRPLWASTSTKNPEYRDVLYIEELIGPHTVETMAPVSVDAFREHGVVRPTLEENVENAYETLRVLGEVGVDYADVTHTLQVKGVELFADSYNQLLEGLEQKRRKLGVPPTSAHYANMQRFRDRIDETLTRFEREGVADRLRQQDASLWSRDSSVQKSVENRLGWLTSHQLMRERLSELDELARDVRQAGFQHAVLLGMGGSSLAPEVLQTSIGNQPGYPELIVLDTTNPDTISRVRKRIDIERTLFIVSSKSGTTVETSTLFNYFYAEVTNATGSNSGSQFIAITDPDTALESLARERGFRAVFRNPPDIGGRYSALSYFGMVPAAIIGLDAGTLLERVDDQIDLKLGVTLGVLAKQGRDKLTFVLPDRIAGLADWLEQLLAESTGKEGKGIIPIAREPIGPPHSYASDRVFVAINLDGEPNEGAAAALAELEASGQEIIRLALRDVYDIGAEFFRWEVATAVAAILLEVNPFDEPNVQESKDNTNRLLDEYRRNGQLPALSFAHETDYVTYSDFDAGSLGNAINRFLEGVRFGDYLAILAFADLRPDVQQQLEEIRRHLRERLSVATTLGYGPRYLHSIGQLFKGGPPMGAFLQIVVEPATRLEIPEEDYPFEVLFAAQGLGDYQALQSRGRPLLRVTITGDVNAGLELISRSVLSAAMR